MNKNSLVEKLIARIQQNQQCTRTQAAQVIAGRLGVAESAVWRWAAGGTMAGTATAAVELLLAIEEGRLVWSAKTESPAVSV